MKTNSLICAILSATTLCVLPQLSAQELDLAGKPQPLPVGVIHEASAPAGPSGIITTIAGNGWEGVSGNGGPALLAEFAEPVAVVADSKGNFYVADEDSNTIREVAAATGIVSVYAGTGVGGFSGDGGLATKAELALPNGLAMDSANNLYISDSANNRIRRVDAVTGKISTVAGSGIPASPITGLNMCTLDSGALATASALCFPQAIALDASGNLYIAEADDVVNRVDAKAGILTIIAGNGSFGLTGDGGPAANAEVSIVNGIAVDKSGNVFLADADNCTIRRIDGKTDIITSLVTGGESTYYNECGLSGDGGPASAAKINFPRGLAVDASGNLFFADYGNNLIRVIEAANGNIYTVAGSYPPGLNETGSFDEGYSGDGGPATGAKLAFPESVAFGPSGNLFIADYGNRVIRKVAAGNILPSTAPVITPVDTTNIGGIIEMPAVVSITPAKAGETVFYTIDGSVPTTASPRYTAPFTVDTTTIVNAFSPGTPNSIAAVSDFFDAPAPMLSSGPSTSGYYPVGTKLTITDANPKAAIYYATNSVPPDEVGSNLTKYTGPINLPAGTTEYEAYVWTSVKDFSGHIVGSWSGGNGAAYSVLPAPVSVPVAATSITKSSATLNGTISVNFSPSQTVTYQFVWGPASSPNANLTPLQTVNAASSGVKVTAKLTGLAPSTSYSFHLRAQDAINAPKFAFSQVLTFTTPAN
jgi:sugar lactone lactonase YvrE